MKKQSPSSKSKNSVQARNQNNKTASFAQKAKEPKVLGPSLFERFETFGAKHDKWLMLGVTLLSLICSMLIFDLKFSIGGDDTSYIERAYNYVHKGTYPYYQGPGYHLALAGMINIFGYNVAIFKIFSLLFYTGHIVFTWLAFRKRLPYFILVFMVGFAVVSDYMQYYSSQTWSEAFFMLIQSIVLWLVMKVVSIEQPESGILADWKKKWWLWLSIGLAFAFMSMTKTVAIFAIGAPLLYFLIQKKYKYSIYILISFLVFKFGIGFTEKAIYGPDPGSSQWEQMKLKDAYNPQKGKLNTAGFINRFGANLRTYSSIHFCRLVHIMPENVYRLTPEPKEKSLKALKIAEAKEDSAGRALTVIMTLLLIGGSVVIFIYDRKSFFLVLYTLVMCGGIFFGIHATNRQDRLIVVLFPFILMILAYGLYLLVKNIRIMQIILASILGLTLVASLYHLLGKAPEKLDQLQKNMAGQKYYGYTEDWINYFEMSDWCVKNLPEGSLVGCKKPTMCFAATHEQIWYGISVVESKSHCEEKDFTCHADYWLKRLKEAKITHLLVADLRAIPTKKTKNLIITIHKIKGYIEFKYPKKIKKIKTIGNEEKSELWELNYDG